LVFYHFNTNKSKFHAKHLAQPAVTYPCAQQNLLDGVSGSCASKITTLQLERCDCHELNNSSTLQHLQHLF